MGDDPLQPEPEKPRFLLPHGCSDLFDALRLRQMTNGVERDASAASADFRQSLPKSVALPDPVGVRDLASALQLKPFQVIGSLMQLNVFCSINAQLNFDTASAVCTHHGIAATEIV